MAKRVTVDDVEVEPIKYVCASCRSADSYRSWSVGSKGGIPQQATTNRPPARHNQPNPLHRKLRWFTCGHAYQLALDRRTLRRDDTLKDFHELMKQHTDAGSITRQETVSMIPPVVLDVRPEHRVRVAWQTFHWPHHLAACSCDPNRPALIDRDAHPIHITQVLDMCAAPGSKTSQMLEVVNSGCARTGVDPEGYVIANDSETTRAYMLVHQCKRINTAVGTM